MDTIRQAAIVIAASARLLARVAGMQAENDYRKHRGEQVAFTEESFLALIDDEGLGHNAVLITLRGG